MRDCIAHQYGCSCEEGQCKSKAIPLGRFVKPQPTPCNTTNWSYAIIFVFVALCVWAGAVYGAPEHQRLALVNQEMRP